MTFKKLGEHYPKLGDVCILIDISGSTHFDMMYDEDDEDDDIGGFFIDENDVLTLEVESIESFSVTGNRLK